MRTYWHQRSLLSVTRIPATAWGCLAMSDPQFSHLANGCEATVTCLVEGPWRLQSTWGDVPSWLGRAYLVLVSTLLSPWGQGWKDSMVLTSRVTASLPFCTLLLPASLNICLFGDVPQQTRRSNLQAWLHSPSITWGVSPAIECSLPRQHRIREWWCHGVSFSHRRGAGLFPVWGRPWWSCTQVWYSGPLRFL